MEIKKLTFTLAGIFLMFIMAFVDKAEAITIIPPRTELKADPGKTITASIKIFNETDSLLSLYTSSANFTAKKGKEGIPEFLLPEGSSTDLASWIEVEKGPIEILPSEYRIINYVINVPLDADPGGHYAGIFFGKENPNEQNEKTSVGVSNKAGALVLLSVSGDVDEKGSISEFTLKNEKTFFERLPVEFVIGFENTGNVHLKPEGSITIKNMFGKTVADISVNKPNIGTGANVLPETLRHFDVIWKNNNDDIENPPRGFFENILLEQNNFALGKYTAKLTLAYGSQNAQETKEISFWVFPWHLLLAYGIAGIIFIAISIFAIRKYNKWIISKAMKNSAGR